MTVAALRAAVTGVDLLARADPRSADATDFMQAFTAVSATTDPTASAPASTAPVVSVPDAASASPASSVAAVAAAAAGAPTSLPAVIASTALATIAVPAPEISRAPGPIVSDDTATHVPLADTRPTSDRPEALTDPTGPAAAIPDGDVCTTSAGTAIDISLPPVREPASERPERVSPVDPAATRPGNGGEATVGTAPTGAVAGEKGPGRAAAAATSEPSPASADPDATLSSPGLDASEQAAVGAGPPAPDLPLTNPQGGTVVPRSTERLSVADDEAARGAAVLPSVRDDRRDAPEPPSRAAPADAVTGLRPRQAVSSVAAPETAKIASAQTQAAREDAAAAGPRDAAEPLVPDDHASAALVPIGLDAVAAAGPESDATCAGAIAPLPAGPVAQPLAQQVDPAPKDITSKPRAAAPTTEATRDGDPVAESIGRSRRRSSAEDPIVSGIPFAAPMPSAAPTATSSAAPAVARGPRLATILKKVQAAPVPPAASPQTAQPAAADGPPAPVLMAMLAAAGQAASATAGAAKAPAAASTGSDAAPAALPTTAAMLAARHVDIKPLPSAGQIAAPTAADASTSPPRAARTRSREGEPPAAVDGTGAAPVPTASDMPPPATATPVPTASATPAPPAAPAAAATLAGGAADRSLELARHAAWADGIARDIAAAGAATGSARFTVAPAALGTVAVEVQRAGDGTAIRLQAATPDAQAVLSAARPELFAAARAHGVALSDATVTLAPASRGGDAPAPGHRDGAPAATIAADQRAAPPRAETSLTPAGYGGGTSADAGARGGGQPPARPEVAWTPAAAAAIPAAEADERPRAANGRYA